MARILGHDSRLVAAEVMAIGSVAGLLVGVHLVVPFGFRDELALWYATPHPVAALTAAYVHVDLAHLTGNVGGYLLAAGIAYGLSLAADERRWFHLSWLGFLTVLPVATGLTAAAMVDQAVVGRGFSAVVAGFVGFLIVGGGVALHRVVGLNRGAMWEAVALLAMVVAIEILWLVTDAAPSLVAGLVVIGVGLPAGSLAWRGYRSAPLAGRDGLTRAAGGVLLFALVLAIVSWFILGLFPAQFVGTGHVTNILSHYLGLVYGGITAAWGYRYWSVHPSNRRS